MTALAPSLPTPRLVRAELLKLRKRRGLVAITACLTIGAAVVPYAILAIHRVYAVGWLASVVTGLAMMAGTLAINLYVYRVIEFLVTFALT